MSDPVIAAAIGASGVVVAALVHLLDRTIGKNIAHLGNHLSTFDSKLAALSDRFDGKMDRLSERLESRFDELVKSQIEVHERLSRLEGRVGGTSIPPIKFEP